VVRRKDELERIFDIPLLCKVSTAARLLDVSPSTIRRLVARRRLGHRFVGRALRIPGRDIIKLLGELPATRDTAIVKQRSPTRQAAAAVPA